MVKVSLWCLVIFIFFGCGKDENEAVEVEEVKIAPKMTKIEKREEMPDITETVDFEEELRRRLEIELKKKPKFDFEGAKNKIFLEKFGVDLSQIPKEGKTKDQVEQIIENLASEAANLKFPESKRQEIIERGKKEFPLYKPGDIVEVRTRRGAVYGVLERTYPDKIKIEKFYILLQDIISPHSACFNKEECEKKRDHFLRVNFEIPKDDFKNKCMKDFAPNVYKEEGFVLVDKTWMTIDELFKKKVRPKLRELERKYDRAWEKEARVRVEKQMQEEGLYAP